MRGHLEAEANEGTVASLGWVTPGAATEGVTPLFFFPEKPGNVFLLIAVTITSGAGSISKVGAQNFLMCPHFFVVYPITGHYRKVQSTVRRTELGQRGRAYEAKAIFDFSVTLCQR